MLSVDDIEFKETKAIIDGNKKMKDSIFKLKSWIEKQFNVVVLNVYEDYSENINNPRLEVILEDFKDADLFKAVNGNYDIRKQYLISSKYEEISNNTISNGDNKYFVCYSAY